MTEVSCFSPDNMKAVNRLSPVGRFPSASLEYSSQPQPPAPYAATHGLPLEGDVGSCGASAACTTASSEGSDSGELHKLQSIDGVRAVFCSDLLRLRANPDVPNQQVIQAVAGTGLAPWEIHRPQKFVRELVLRRGFSGRVLDAGCGIGDNALYVAKACPAAEVTAVDVAPRCLDFVATKAGLRGMRDKVTLAVGDLRCYEALPPQLRVGPQYDIVLDSCTFHAFSDPDRLSYVRTLSLLLRTGGLLYMTCMSEEETQPGGPRRVRVDDVHACCNPSTGWEVESVEDTIIELHPTFYAGRSKARLFTIRRL